MSAADEFLEWMGQQPKSVQYHFQGIVVSGMILGLIIGIIIGVLAS